MRDGEGGLGDVGMCVMGGLGDVGMCAVGVGRCWYGRDGVLGDVGMCVMGGWEMSPMYSSE